MNVPEITAVKDQLEELKEKGIIKSWELPYENLLTRLSAAIFFIEPIDEKEPEEAWEKLSAFSNFRYMLNEAQKLSKLKYRIEFNKE